MSFLEQISDALLKLKCPKAGFLADIMPFAPNAPCSDAIAHQSKVIAPASTVYFTPKEQTSSSIKSPSNAIEFNIPLSSHYVDLTESDTIVILSQPPGQECAVLGGIMATRMKYLGAKAAVVDGRIRDLYELRRSGLPVWARSTSTVGTSAEAKPHAINVPVWIGGVEVTPGDVVFADPLEGVVVIPYAKLDAVMELLPRLVGADDRVKGDVEDGVAVKDAFATHRKNL
ncbi:MAG: hypothetical protein M1827_003191 [Pycnora praestabilis]|nr:MAG: hypothetical protein M1827_003191 [Pycnora praestabilis]